MTVDLLQKCHTRYFHQCPTLHIYVGCCRIILLSSTPSPAVSWARWNFSRALGHSLGSGDTYTAGGDRAVYFPVFDPHPELSGLSQRGSALEVMLVPLVKQTRFQIFKDFGHCRTVHIDFLLYKFLVPFRLYKYPHNSVHKIRTVLSLH